MEERQTFRDERGAGFRGEESLAVLMYFGNKGGDERREKRSGGREKEWSSEGEESTYGTKIYGDR